MPQLMPLNWCMSMFMVSLLFIVMMFLYYNRFVYNGEYSSQVCKENILNWKW